MLGTGREGGRIERDEVVDRADRRVGGSAPRIAEGIDTERTLEEHDDLGKIERIEAEVAAEEG